MGGVTKSLSPSRGEAMAGVQPLPLLGEGNKRGGSALIVV